MTFKTVSEALVHIQQNLKAPKNRVNKFANYNYRNCEDILEAAKPLLENATLTVNDDIVEVGGRVYVKATATLCVGDSCLFTNAFAREPEAKKGSDESQITGAASSYARKYALNGLFLIDDTQDADATNDHGKTKETKPIDNTGDKELDKWAKAVIADIQSFTNQDDLDAFMGDVRKDERAKKLTKEQGELIKWQYDETTKKLQREADDFPGMK